jgi:hypothetical protein
MRSTAPTRRQFHGTLAALAAAPAVASADDAPAATSPAQALTALLRSRHGRHLSAEQLQQVRQAVEVNLQVAARLNRVPLQNADEPALSFSADVP